MTRATHRRERQARLARAAMCLQRPVMPGLQPEAPRTILQAEASAPMRGGNADLQHAGLFGDGQKQMSLL